jgi:hypothetical protein
MLWVWVLRGTWIARGAQGNLSPECFDIQQTYGPSEKAVGGEPFGSSQRKLSRREKRFKTGEKEIGNGHGILRGKAERDQQVQQDHPKANSVSRRRVLGL